MTLTLDFQGKIFNSHILGMGRSIDLEWKRCELDAMLDAQWASSWPTVHGKQISFQLVGPWMGYSFTDLGAEGCCRSLNALFMTEDVATVHRRSGPRFDKKTTVFPGMGISIIMIMGISLLVRRIIALRRPAGVFLWTFWYPQRAKTNGNLYTLFWLNASARDTSLWQKYVLFSEMCIFVKQL